MPRTVALEPAEPYPGSDRSSITHSFGRNDHVRACRLFLSRRPLFFSATVVSPVPHIADLYLGRCEGERRLTHFFAHPGDFQTRQAEDVLLLHFRASLQPELFYPLVLDRGRR